MKILFKIIFILYFIYLKIILLIEYMINKYSHVLYISDPT